MEERGDNVEYIDAHSHIWGKQSDAEPEEFTAEQLLRHALPLRVTRTVLIQMSYYRFDNTYMVAAMRRYAGVFSGVAVVDTASSQLAGEMRKLAGTGVRGFRVQPMGQPATWLDAPGMATMWKTCAGEGLAVCPLVDANALASIDRMCGRFPDTRVVIDHLARIGVDGQIRDGDVQQLCGLARHKNVYVKASAFYALGAKRYPYTDLAPLIERVVKAYTPERVMWATDCPYQVEGDHTYAGSLELVRDRLPFLSASDREWILSRTAARVFFHER